MLAKRKGQAAVAKKKVLVSCLLDSSLLGNVSYDQSFHLPHSDTPIEMCYYYAIVVATVAVGSSVMYMFVYSAYPQRCFCVGEGYRAGDGRRIYTRPAK